MPGDPRPGAALLDLSGMRELIWRRLLGTAQAACKNGVDELAEQDAAEALGLIEGDLRLTGAREAAAARLRDEVYRATGKSLAITLRVDRIERCTDQVAQDCPMRQDRYCPRNLRHAQRERRLQQAREARGRGVPWDLAQKAALDQLPETDALRAARRFADNRRNVLVFANDDDGSGSVAAAWAMYTLTSGRFVPMSRLRFAKRDDQFVQEVLGATVLALDGVCDRPAPAAELVALIIDNVVRGRGKLVLTTTEQSSPFLAALPPRQQEQIQKHGDVVPIAPEQGALL